MNRRGFFDNIFFPFLTLDRNTIYTVDSHFILKCFRIMTNRCFFSINIIFNLMKRIFITSMFSLYWIYLFYVWTFLIYIKRSLCTFLFTLVLFFINFAWLFECLRCCFRFIWNWNLLKTSAWWHYGLRKKYFYLILFIALVKNQQQLQPIASCLS